MRFPNILASLRVIFAAGLLAALHFSAAAEKWVSFDATNFPDKNFRSLLQNTTLYASAFDKTNHPDQINVDAITHLNLSVTTTTCKAIASVKGVEQFRNLEKITLPGIGIKSAYKLTSLDVSGLQYLTTITNGTYTSINAVGSWVTTYGSDKPSSYIGNCKKYLPLKTLRADNCPRLKEIRLAAYPNLVTFSIGGSENIEELYLADCQSLKSLDVSHLKNLKNDHACTQIGMKRYANLSLLRCKALEELTLGDDSPLEFIDLTDCLALQTIDLSSMGKAKFVFMNNNSVGATDNIILGEHPDLEKFEVKNTNLSQLDFPALRHASTIKLSHSLFRCIDVAAFTSATSIDLTYNKLRHTDLPPNKGCSSFEIGGNEMTDVPQFRTEKSGGWTYTYSIMRGRTSRNMERAIGNVMKYRIFENEEQARFFVKQDVGIYAKAPVGAHLGDPSTTPGESVCYLYMDDDFHQVEYYLWVPYKDQKSEFASDMTSYYKVTLTRGEPAEEPAEDFYIAGEFNNWQPTEAHRFTALGDGRYTLSLDESIIGCFRVVNASDMSAATLSFGGHSTQTRNDGDPHVQVLSNVRYKLGEDDAMHYSSTPDGGHSLAIVRPRIEMMYLPGDVHNHIILNGDVITSIDNIAAGDDTAATPVYYNLQGVRIDNPSAPGVYIIKKGSIVTKAIIR